VIAREFATEVELKRRNPIAIVPSEGVGYRSSIWIIENGVPPWVTPVPFLDVITYPGAQARVLKCASDVSHFAG
jgi:hypothetical protein